ncbi:MAG: UDP-N-acetylmuramoyl-L-alanine--D-glutamate ligase [Bacillota bacterium]
MELAGKRVLVAGMARSGLAATRLLVRRGAKVTIYDRKTPEEMESEISSIPPGVKTVLGQHQKLVTGVFDLVVTSPGIPLDNPLLAHCIEDGIPVISEIELAFRLKPPGLQFLAITGTNGKTTTTALVADILHKSGIPSAAAGNIGLPLTQVIEELDRGMVAVECSSFQLETITHFHPAASGVLNITPDHLDRHHTMENYAAIKSRIFMNQTPDEYTILNHEDPWIAGFSPRCKACFFSTDRVLKQGVWIEDGMIIASLEGEREPICELSEVRLRGRHNLENVLCAVGITRAVRIPPEAIKRALVSFKGVRHRLQEVKTVNGVLYVNDSKGTNPDSTIKALEAFTEPVILIAGGRNKGSDFRKLAELITQKVKALVLLGEARSIIRQTVEDRGFKDIVEVESIEEAVSAAHSMAQPGEVVLLSPACASWDMFKDYEERGDLFCSAVMALGEDELCV